MAIALALAMLGACAGHAPPARVSGSGDAVTAAIGERAAGIALQQVGAPYRYGGSSPAGFDCSGLVYFSYRHAGLPVPRTTTQLWSSIAAVERGDLQTGDVLFFRIEGKMSHVGLYVGDNRFVHAPKSGRAVSVESLRSDFYAQAFVRGGRPE